MNREYRNELPELKEKPTEQINGIYIIPYKEYNGFWGKNGYKSYDFIFENKQGKKIGWCHWEGDVIHLENNHIYGMNIDCSNENDYLHLFTTIGFEISDMLISDLEIKTKGEIKMEEDIKDSIDCVYRFITKVEFIDFRKYRITSRIETDKEFSFIFTYDANHTYDANIYEIQKQIDKEIIKLYRL